MFRPRENLAWWSLASLSAAAHGGGRAADEITQRAGPHRPRREESPHDGDALRQAEALAPELAVGHALEGPCEREAEELALLEDLRRREIGGFSGSPPQVVGDAGGSPPPQPRGRAGLRACTLYSCSLVGTTNSAEFPAAERTTKESPPCQT